MSLKKLSLDQLYLNALQVNIKIKGRCVSTILKQKISMAMFITTDFSMVKTKLKLIKGKLFTCEKALFYIQYDDTDFYKVYFNVYITYSAKKR